LRTIGRGEGPKLEKESRNLLTEAVSGYGVNGVLGTFSCVESSPTKLSRNRSLEGSELEVQLTVIGISSVTGAIYTIKI
jgi:hypothetical protein